MMTPRSPNKLTDQTMVPQADLDPEPQPDTLAGIERSNNVPWREDAGRPNPTERLLVLMTAVKPTGGQNDAIDRVRAAYIKLGQDLCRDVPPGPELTVAIRKLVESKDCAVRAILFP